jgi:hypothetical protein
MEFKFKIKLKELKLRWAPIPHNLGLDLQVHRYTWQRASYQPDRIPENSIRLIGCRNTWICLAYIHCMPPKAPESYVMPRTVCDWLQASYCTNMRPFTSLFEGKITHQGCNFLMTYRTFVYGVQVQKKCLHLLFTRERCGFSIRTSASRNCISRVSLRDKRNVAFIPSVSGNCCASKRI